MLYKKFSEKTTSNTAKYRSITPGIMEKNDYFKQSDFRRPSSKREKEKENKQTNKLEVNSEWFNGKKKNSHISATNYQ